MITVALHMESKSNLCELKKKLPDSTKFVCLEKVAVIDDSNFIGVEKIQNHKSSRYNIHIQLDKEGTEKFSKITKEGLNKRLIILINGKTEMAPVIRGKIDGSRIFIAMDKGKSTASSIERRLKQQISRRKKLSSDAKRLQIMNEIHGLNSRIDFKKSQIFSYQAILDSNPKLRGHYDHMISNLNTDIQRLEFEKNRLQLKLNLTY